MAFPKSSLPKKVRSACQRCRNRRIKCDGQVPSCGNCSKIGELCVDVDIQNQDVLIPRNFPHTARARIQWLEGIIRERLPDVDLRQGPQIETLPRRTSNINAQTTNQNVENAPTSISAGYIASTLHSEAEGRQPGKRTRNDIAASSEEEDALPEGAHLLAVNLGMLSLNSDSSQKHYLGSSSGLLFSNLIAASPSRTEATPESSKDLPGYHTGLGKRVMHLDIAQKRFQSLQTWLKEHLPKREDANTLLQTYIHETHPDFPVLDPKGLFSALEALYQCCTVDSEDMFHNDWPSSVPDFRWNGQDPILSKSAGKSVPLPVIAFIHFMIFNTAAIVKVRARIYDFSPEMFYRAALLFSGDCFSQISISSIQAIVMLIIHSILTPAEVNLWTVIHIAMAQVVELGLHREPQQNSTQDEGVQRIHRFIFYVIYSIDRSVSTIQGRPLGFRDETFDVKIPEQDGSAPDIDDGQIAATFSTDVLKYSTHVFKLDRIVSDIKLHLYHLPVSSTFPALADPEFHQKRIMADLQSWWAKVSENELGLLGLDNRQKQMWFFKLKNRYYTTMLLLFQPSQSIRNPTEQSLQTCFDCASTILRTYQLLHDNHCLHFGWRTVQNIFAAGATLIYTFWTSPCVQASTSIVDLSRSFRVCSSLLSVGGEWWHSVKMGKNSLETVADLTIQKLHTLNVPSKQRRIVGGPSLYRQDERGSKSEDRQTQEIPDPVTSDRSITGSLPNVDFGAQSSANFVNFSNSRLTEDPSQWNFTIGHGYRQMQEQWQMYPDDISAQTMSGMGIAPEVENFLAGFDNSEFSWNFPLNAGDGQADDFDFFGNS